MTNEERRLVEFVLWNIRVADLPADVRMAAQRVAETNTYPRPDDFEEFPQPGLRVTLIPAEDTADPIERRTVAAGTAVDAFVAEHPDFYAVLVQRVPQA